MFCQLYIVSQFHILSQSQSVNQAHNVCQSQSVSQPQSVNDPHSVCQPQSVNQSQCFVNLTETINFILTIKQGDYNVNIYLHSTFCIQDEVNNMKENKNISLTS